MCQDPCLECNANNVCTSCQSPFNSVPSSSGLCFLCFDPNCQTCTNATNGTCQTCNPGYSVSNGMCVNSSCGTGCITCTNNVCTKCVTNFYALINGACELCPDAPKCQLCDSTGCTKCNPGYYLANNTCMACQPFCNVCENSTFCVTPFNVIGVTLIETAVGVNTLAACDPYCLTCAQSHPSRCSLCLPGYYVSTDNTCQPCTYSSRC